MSTETWLIVPLLLSLALNLRLLLWWFGSEATTSRLRAQIEAARREGRAP